MDDERAAREVARFNGFSDAEADAARDVLSPWPDGFKVRFTELVMFAKTYGVGLQALAQWVSEETSGIEPFESTSDIPREDWDRINAAISATRAAQGVETHWPETILSLLDELDAERTGCEQRPSFS